MYRVTVTYVVNGSTHCVTWRASKVSVQRNGNAVQMIFANGDGAIEGSTVRADTPPPGRVHSETYADAPLVRVESVDA